MGKFVSGRQPRPLRDPRRAEHRKAIQTMLEFKHGIDADLADLRPWLAENEVAAVATTRGIKLVCDMGIKNRPEDREDVAGIQPEKLREHFMAEADQREKIFTTTEEEISGIALGAHVDSARRAASDQPHPTFGGRQDRPDAGAAQACADRCPGGPAWRPVCLCRGQRAALCSRCIDLRSRRDRAIAKRLRFERASSSRSGRS